MQSYFEAWLVYLLAVSGLLVVAWRLSRSWPPALRWPLRSVVAAFLLLPWRVAPGHMELGPAWLISLFDGLLQQHSDAWRAGVPLLVTVILGGLLGVLVYRRDRRRLADG